MRRRVLTFAVVNESQRVTTRQLSKILAAVNKQQTRDVDPLYGGQTLQFELVPKGRKPKAGRPVALVTDKPTIPGAAGYHDVDERGLPRIFVFVDPTLDNGGDVMRGANSVSVTFSHEACEARGDMPANIWADGPDGNDFAYELCDAVEGDAYDIDGVSVSNFVTPDFFNPQAPDGTKLDFMSTLSTPFAMTPGGYQITRSEPGAVSQVFAHSHTHDLGGRVHVHFGPEFPEWKRQSKLAKAYRRRGHGKAA